MRELMDVSQSEDGFAIRHRALGHTAHTKGNKLRLILLNNRDEPYCGLTYWNSHPCNTINRARHVARRRHVLGAPATRGKRRVMAEYMRRALLTTCADTGPDYQQHIRNSNASIRHETIDLAKPLWRACASDCPTSADQSHG
jgi:hypothetical protein